MILRIFLLGLISIDVSAQGNRVDNRVTTSQANVPFGGQAPVLTLPLATVSVCAYPAISSPCTNRVSIYTDQAMTQPATNPLQADGQGKYGFWIAAGTYTYSVTTVGGVTLGTYPFTVGGSGGAVTSVNGQAGVVTITPASIGAQQALTLTTNSGSTATLSGGRLNIPPSVASPATSSAIGSVQLPSGQTSTTLALPAITGNYKDLFYDPVQSAASYQSAPTTYNGIANALAGCGAAGCSIQVSSLYPFDAERGYLLTGPKQHIIDNRGGVNRHIYNDMGTPTLFLGPVGDQADCRSHIASAGNCRETDYYLTQPGYDLGPNGHPTNNGWTQIQGHLVNVTAATQGIKSAGDQYLNCTGLGDCHGPYLYVTSHGGNVEVAAEGNQANASQVNESPTMYAGVVASIAGDTITSNVSGGSYADLGVGQRIVNTTTPLASGYITGTSSITDGNGLPYTVLTMTGATVTPSKWWGQITSSLDIPSIESTGTNTVTTPVTASFTTVGGSGTPAVGDTLTFGFDQVNTVTITSVAAISGGYTLGFGAYFGINAGSLAFDTPWGPGGLELTQNTVGGIEYDLDVLGATDSTHLVAVQVVAGSDAPFSLGLADFSSYTMLGTLTNTGGVTTVAPNVSNVTFYPKFSSYPAITISGATNSAFNGTCTNVGNLQASVFPPSFTCTQSGASGQTSATTSASFTYGTTGYGTAGFVLRRMARVIDIQTYATGATPTVPVNTQTLRLGVNNLNLSVGNSIRMGHHYAMTEVSQFHNMDVENPYSQGTARQIGIGGHSVNGNYHADYVTNSNQPNLYAGAGGDIPSAPQGYHLGGPGPWQYFSKMDNAPFPNGSNWGSIGCPATPLGCNDPLYSYNWMFFSGRGSNDAIGYTPYTKTLSFTMPHLSFANGAIPVASLVSSSTTVNGTNCALGGTCTLATPITLTTTGTTGPASLTGSTLNIPNYSTSDIRGTAALVSGSYTANFNPAFTSGTVGCTANDQGNATIGVGTPTLTGATFTGTGTDTFYYHCFLLNQATLPPASYNGTVVGTPTFGAAKFANGLTAVTDSNYISLPTGTFGVAASTPISFDAQVKATSTTGLFVALSFSGSDWWMGMSNGQPSAVIGGSSVSCPVTIGDGAFHHECVSVDASGTYRFFVDGTQCGATGTATLAASPTSGYIGRYTSTGYAWPGSIDEVAVWNTVTHTANFTAPTAAYTGYETGLRALYHLQANGNEF